MIVFADFHHSDLYYSLHLLFEKRWGWELYCPIGSEWFTDGYWKIAEPYNNHPETIAQYLDIRVADFDQYKHLNGDNYEKNGVYYCYDPVHAFTRKAITLEKFKELKPDIVISSYEPHDTTFARLIATHSPSSKHVAQMGNTYQTTNVPNVMCSTAPYPVESGKNVVFYHQEFDLNDFGYEPPQESNKVTSFVNLLPKPELFELFRSSLPNLEWKAYGASCPDGTVTGTKNIAQLMKDSLFGYHIKPGGDGFGHVIHNWFACGRPLIVSGNDYQDKLAGGLLEDGVTCIDIDKRSFNQTVDAIRYWSEPTNHKELCESVIKRFRATVDFDREEVALKNFFEKII